MAFGTIGGFGGSSAGFVVAALNAASAASRELVVPSCPVGSHLVSSRQRLTSAGASLLPLPPELGPARVRHSKLTQVGNIRLGVGERESSHDCMCQ